MRRSDLASDAWFCAKATVAFPCSICQSVFENWCGAKKKSADLLIFRKFEKKSVKFAKIQSNHV
jgi:hypothetical protein